MQKKSKIEIFPRDEKGMRWLEAENKTQKAFPRLQGKRKKKQDNVSEKRKKIKAETIKLIHLILTIPAEQLTEEEIGTATVLVKSRTVQEVWEKTKKR